MTTDSNAVIIAIITAYDVHCNVAIDLFLVKQNGATNKAPTYKTKLSVVICFDISRSILGKSVTIIDDITSPHTDSEIYINVIEYNT
jgi:hypothetical protein